MIVPIKKKLVNYVDGMKLRRTHLIQSEDYFIDIIRDARNIRLTNYNYGILPSQQADVYSCDFDIVQRITNHISIEVRSCNAITAGGCRIDIHPDGGAAALTKDLILDLKNEDAELQHQQTTFWDVVLSVRIFDRIATGSPDEEETPLRQPDAVQSYDLLLRPAGQINMDEFGMNSLIIGRVIKTADVISIDKTYIPASTSMTSHPELKRLYEKFGKLLNDIEVSSQTIIRKIQDMRSSSQIAVNTHMISEALLTYIGNIYYGYRNKGRYYLPTDIVELFSSMAHICFVTINRIPRKEREEALQYFYEWSEVKPGKFLELLTGMIELTYNHQDIRGAMNQTERFLSVFSSLWSTLATLEYIGQHKENIIVAEKNIEVETGPKKRGWTILD